MSPGARFEDLWSRTADDTFRALPTDQRDQVTAAVRALCRDPYAEGTVELVRPARTRAVAVGTLRVLYQVDEVGDLVYVIGIETRG